MRRKVIFKLFQDNDGYPPHHYESLWAERQPDGNYRLLNTPFYATGISYGDVVAVEEVEGEIWYLKTVEKSGRKTARIIFFEHDNIQEVLAKIESLGISWEGADIPSLFALDIPDTTKLESLLEAIKPYIDKELIDYEEGDV